MDLENSTGSQCVAYIKASDITDTTAAGPSVKWEGGWGEISLV